ncbi:MAG: nucleoside recognition domain-containing protein [Vicinamibacterales bacterium]
MLNGLFVTVSLISILLAASTGRMEALTTGVMTSASDAVELAIGLVGTMAFFLGLIRIAQDAGLMEKVARGLNRPIRLLFPTLPHNSPAIGAIVLNLSANMFGLANAATPFGIKAMQELDKHNGQSGTATNAMVMFLAINTSALAILPTGMVALRVSMGSQDPAGIFLTTWFASACATIVAILAATLLSQLRRYSTTEPNCIEPPTLVNDENSDTAITSPKATAADLEPTLVRLWLNRFFWLTLFTLAIRSIATQTGSASVFELVRSIMSFWTIPIIIAALVTYGWVRGVAVYESLVEGAKEGFEVALRIIPFLVAILVLIGMFRTSGALDVLVSFLTPLTVLIGMPAEVLPLAVLRPFSGSGSFALAAETMQTHGPDTLIGYMSGTFTGSTETTFYTLAVYYGAIGIRNTRHTVPACLAADVTGILAATFIVNLLFG